MIRVLIVEDHGERASVLCKAVASKWPKEADGANTPGGIAHELIATRAIAALGAACFDVVLLDCDLDLDGTAPILMTGTGLDVVVEIAKRGGPPTVVHSRNFLAAQACVATLVAAGVPVAWAPHAWAPGAPNGDVQARAVAATALAFVAAFKENT